MERPIGYWLKHLDGLIEAAFDRTLAAQQLTRRHWQAMNAVANAALDEHGLGEALRPFWGAGGITLGEVTGDLERRGWIARGGDGRYTLTPRGEATHAAVREQVQAIRGRMIEGLTEQEYHATVRVLRRMAENLEELPVR
jgi:DNA-binding MarR family transcriptional regulator